MSEFRVVHLQLVSGTFHFMLHLWPAAFFFITSLRYVFGHSCLHANSKGHRQRFSRMWRTISFFVEDWDCEREGKIKINKISKDKRIEEDKRKYPSGRKILIKTFVSILCLTIGFSEPNIKLQVCMGVCVCGYGCRRCRSILFKQLNVPRFFLSYKA